MKREKTVHNRRRWLIFLVCIILFPAPVVTAFGAANLMPVYHLLLLSGGKYAKGVLVKDIWPGTESSEADEFTVLNGKLYFNAMDDTHGGEVWTSDGTTEGTMLLKDIRTGPESSNQVDQGGYTVGWNREFALFKGYVYFAATDSNADARLWRSDGSAAGTVQFGPNYAGPAGFTEYNNELFFTACDSTYGCELRKTDGTEGGTVLVKNIADGSDSSWPNDFGSLTEYNNELYFSVANTGTEVCQLWKTNGTEAGTVPVRPGTAIDADAIQIVYNNNLYFAANSGELWVTDGSSGATQMLKYINPGSGGSSGISGFTLLANKLFFRAQEDISGSELWMTDGTTAGTVMVKDINPVGSSYPGYLTVFNNMLYFRADDGSHGSELWKSDGTPEGTVLALDIFEGATGSSPRGFTPFNGSLYFGADDGAHGDELWRVDGISGEAVFGVDVIHGAEGSEPYYLTVFNNALYFQGYDSEHGYELWMLK